MPNHTSNLPIFIVRAVDALALGGGVILVLVVLVNVLATLLNALTIGFAGRF